MIYFVAESYEVVIVDSSTSPRTQKELVFENSNLKKWDLAVLSYMWRG